MTIASGTFLGPYEILGLVGAGGMGEVYRARDSRLGRYVAVKVIPPTTATDRDRLHRFEREARLASSLNHPNIVTIYDIGEENGIPYIAMELIEGKTLREVITAGNIPLRQILSIAVQTSDALAKAHDSGIVHRDLKPENVMLTNDGVVKVLDFGLGKNTPLPVSFTESTVMAARDATNPGTIMGTVDYMSPEQAAGRDVDFHSDQFSLGSIIFEMVSGSRPFRRDTVVQTMSAIIAEPEPSLSADLQVPETLQDIVNRCHQKEPEQRYPSTRELTTELRELSFVLEASNSKLTKVLPKTETVTIKREQKRLPFRLIAIGAVFLLALTLLLVPSTRRRLLQFLPHSEPLPAAKNLVVLPFRTADTDPQHQTFAAGLTETITTALTQLTVDPSLQMSPASEIRNRRITTADDAKRVLAANLVLTGVIDTMGDSLRLQWNIEDASTNRALRSGTVSVNASQPLELESKTIETLIGSLELNVSSALKAALLQPTTLVPAAKDAYLRGRGYLQEYDKEENVNHAIALFEEAARLDPKYAQAYAAIGEAYWRESQHSRTNDWIAPAQARCEKAITLNENIAAGHGCLGAVYLTLGHYEDAIREYRRALQSEPTSDNFRREVARAEERVGRLQDSEKTLKEAIQLRPQYWSNYNALGGFYFNQGRYSEAADMFSRVIQLAPDTAFGYANLAGAYIKVARYKEAIPMLERAATIRPTGLAYSNLATTYFQIRQFAEAADTFEKAAKLDEKNYAVWGNLADAYYWTAGKRELSSDTYQKAVALGDEVLKVNARDAILLSRLAWYYTMLGNQPRASTYLKRALDIAPKDQEVLFKAALIYNQLKDDEQALDWLDKAASAGYSITTIRDVPNFDHLWASPKFQNLIRKQ